MGAVFTVKESHLILPYGALSVLVMKRVPSTSNIFITPRLHYLMSYLKTLPNAKHSYLCAHVISLLL